MKHPIHNPNFRILFVARFIDELAMGFFTIPLFWWILTTFADAGSGSLIAVAALASSLSYLVAAPWGGVLADRWRKKYLIVSSNLLNLAFAALVGALIFAGAANFYWVLGFLIVSGLASAARQPSLSALLPLLLTEEQYQRGNATMGLATQFASLSSFAIAGLITATLGVAAAIFVGVGLLLIGGFVMLALKEPIIAMSEPAATTTEDSRQTSKLAYLLGGFLLLGRTPLLLSLVLTATLLNFILSPFTVILAPYAEQLGAGVQGFGNLAAAIIAGKLLGMVLMNVFRVKRLLRMLVGGTLGIALGLLGLALAPHLLFAMGAIMVAGACATMMGVQISTVVQKNVPRELMGRTVGLMSTLGEGAAPAGYAVAGVLLAITSPASIFAGMFVLMALGSLVWLRPSVRDRLQP
jgi:DHA3 family macrolide efflux protein-like MFS transporter